MPRVALIGSGPRHVTRINKTSMILSISVKGYSEKVVLAIHISAGGFLRVLFLPKELQGLMGHSFLEQSVQRDICTMEAARSQLGTPQNCSVDRLHDARFSWPKVYDVPEAEGVCPDRSSASPAARALTGIWEGCGVGSDKGGAPGTGDGLGAGAAL